jgi:hypothetical protein
MSLLSFHELCGEIDTGFSTKDRECGNVFRSYHPLKDIEETCSAIEEVIFVFEETGQIKRAQTGLLI